MSLNLFTFGERIELLFWPSQNILNFSIYEVGHGGAHDVAVGVQGSRDSLHDNYLSQKKGEVTLKFYAVAGCDGQNLLNCGSDIDVWDR